MIQQGKRSAATLARPSARAPDQEAGPGLDRVIQSRIGDNLRAMYDDLLQQPVPDRFKDLLGQFEQQSDRKGQSR